MEPKLTKREWMATILLAGLESSFDTVNRFLPTDDAVELAVEQADKLIARIKLTERRQTFINLTRKNKQK